MPIFFKFQQCLFWSLTNCQTYGFYAYREYYLVLIDEKVKNNKHTSEEDFYIYNDFGLSTELDSKVLLHLLLKLEVAYVCVRYIWKKKTNIELHPRYHMYLLAQ